MLEILVVAPISEDKRNFVLSRIENKRSRVATMLNVEKDRLKYENLTATEFFQKNMKLAYFDKLSSAGDDDPF